MAQQSYPPNSSAFNAIVYDDETESLDVEFKDGQTYHWDGFPPDVFAQWMTSGSRGAFFNLNIRGQY
jgi:hypothetical protein